MDQSTPGTPVFHCLLQFGQTHVCSFENTVQPSGVAWGVQGGRLHRAQHLGARARTRSSLVLALSGSVRPRRPLSFGALALCPAPSPISPLPARISRRRLSRGQGWAGLRSQFSRATPSSGSAVAAAHRSAPDKASARTRSEAARTKSEGGSGRETGAFFDPGKSAPSAGLSGGAALSRTAGSPSGRFSWDLAKSCPPARHARRGLPGGEAPAFPTCGTPSRGLPLANPGG
ncbi:uncharacterized protein LOC118081469 [Zootoca vivipara]|uniref:uncharacterized protein LOC118081469 n=1 Tax=Zootoca vivipara TaxID=8524 RepID=UPI00293B8F9C|nr:uncharacterized protein LOC118081469 [Zootoca vivipara]